MALARLLDWWPDWWAIALAIILILAMIVPHFIFPERLEPEWVDLMLLIFLLPLIGTYKRIIVEEKTNEMSENE